MDSEVLIKEWKAEAERPIIGWDFSYLDGRMLCWKSLPGRTQVAHEPADAQRAFRA